MNRRQTIKSISGMAAAAALAHALGNRVKAAEQEGAGKGRFRHSVCRWCFSGIPLDEFCQEVKKIGIESVELIGADEWEVTKRHGLECAIGAVGANPARTQPGRSSRC